MWEKNSMRIVSNCESFLLFYNENARVADLTNGQNYYFTYVQGFSIVLYGPATPNFATFETRTFTRQKWYFHLHMPEKLLVIQIGYWEINTQFSNWLVFLLFTMVKIWIQKIAKIQIHTCSLNKGGKRLNHSQATPKQIKYA